MNIPMTARVTNESTTVHVKDVVAGAVVVLNGEALVVSQFSGSAETKNDDCTICFNLSTGEFIDVQFNTKVKLGSLTKYDVEVKV